MNRARSAAPLTGLAASLVLAACGVPTSGVIQAGDPATGMAPGLNVYFLAGGELVAVPRRVDGGADTATAVRLVFEGPAGAEAYKLRTQLPRLPGPPTVLTDGSSVLVRLPPGVGPLSRPAMAQLACTVGGVPPTAPPRTPGTPGTPADSADSAPSAVPTGLPRRLPGRVSLRVSGSGWESVLDATACAAGGG